MLMDSELAQKIRRFVEQGGTFILSAHSAVKNRDNAMTEQVKPILLSDLFGVEVIDFQCYQPPSRKKNAIRFEDAAPVPVNVFAEVLQTTRAAAVATWEHDAMKGSPAATENKYGKGTAVYYASFFNLEAARHLIRRYAAEHNLKPLLAGVPSGVEVTRRSKGQNHYYFVLNHDDQSVVVKPGPGYFDLLENAPAPANMTLKPFEYKVLRRSQ
jgi:beta-galactosidase